MFNGFYDLFYHAEGSQVGENCPNEIVWSDVLFTKSSQASSGSWRISRRWTGTDYKQKVEWLASQDSGLQCPISADFVLRSSAALAAANYARDGNISSRWW